MLILKNWGGRNGWFVMNQGGGVECCFGHASAAAAAAWCDRYRPGMETCTEDWWAVEVDTFKARCAA